MSASSVILATDLYKALAQECELGMTLVDILFEEQTSLVKLETARLQEISLKKEGMMFDLERRYQNNISLAKANGFTESFEGLEAWVTSLSKQEPKLQGTLGTLKATLHQAQRINQTNGELVAEQMAGLQQRISILTAAAVAEQTGRSSDTYSAKGSMQQKGSTAGNTRAIIK
jgi:flagella synthesis protein FlgN